MRVESEHLCIAEVQQASKAIFQEDPLIFGGLAWFVTKCSTNNRTTLYVSAEILRQMSTFANYLLPEAATPVIYQAGR